MTPAVGTKPRILVAGIGNIFFGDDAFGPAVLRKLVKEPALAGARCEDFGIRGLHLAYELLAGYSAAVLVDAVSRGGSPGTLYVIEPSEPIEVTAPDAHRMDIGSVFGFVRMLEAKPPPVTIVGCEPESLGEGDDLSATVARAVETALPLVRRVASDILSTLESTEELECEA